MLGGTGLLAEGLDALHHQVGLGQQAEVVRQVFLDVGDVGGGFVDVGLAAFIGVREQPLRIGLHVLEERGQVAFDAQGLLHLLELAAQARDLRQAELVDLVGGHAGRGIHLQLVGVVRRTVGMRGAHAAGIHRRLRQFLAGERDDPLVGRLDAVEQRLARFGLECSGAFGADLAVLRQCVRLGLRIGPQRAVLAAVEGRAGDDLGRLVDHAFIGELRRTDALHGRRARAFQRLVEGGAELLQAGDVGQVILLVRDLVEINQEGRRETLHAAHLLERIAVADEGHAVAGVLDLLLPEVERQLRFRIQRFVFEAGFHLLHRGFLPGQLLAHAGFRHVVDLVVQLLAAEHGQLDRAELQLLFVFFLEPRIEARGLGLDLFGGGRSGGRGRGRRGVGGGFRAGSHAKAEAEGDGKRER